MGIRIGEAEINYLYIVSIVGDHYVFWLQIAMNYLLAVHIGKGVAQIQQNLDGYLFGETLFSDPLRESFAVYSFHFYAVPKLRLLQEGIVLADARM